MNLRSCRLFLCTTVLLCAAVSPVAMADTASVSPAHRVIIFVWDGLRPDLISTTDTPNLAALRSQGVNFVDHHSTYPTFTMINAASLATGAYPQTHGFYGNSFWAPQARGHDAENHPVDFSRPVFTEDYAILQALDRAVQGKLLAVPTLFEAAHQAGMITAVVGKGGPTFLQSRGSADFFMDDKTVMPLSAAEHLNKAGFPLPPSWANAYSFATVPDYPVARNLSAGNVFPLMNDGITSDPSQHNAALGVATNDYQADVYLDYVLPVMQPRLSMLWLRNPDGTEHAFGPGSAATRNVLHANDVVLGLLLKKLDTLGWREHTDVILVSDHAHSSVSGALQYFPLRAIHDGSVGGVDPDGFSVSGEVRSADLLRRAGLMAFDGNGPQCNPVMSGITADGTSIYTHQPVDLFNACREGSYITGNFMIPDAEYLHQPYAVIAINGGSEFYYVPSHDKTFVQRLVRFFQSHEQYGAVFVDAQRYGNIAGTLPLASVHLQNEARNSPDVIVSYAFDANARIGNVPGIEYSGGAFSSRGMHGSFSPRDVHNVLIATGPDFKQHYADSTPSANVDVAPTVAALLGLPMPTAEGRVLAESLLNTAQRVLSVKVQVVHPAGPAHKLTMIKPVDPDGHDVDPSASNYTFELHTTVVRQKTGLTTREYRYYDSATASRY
ncbi:MAG TPA: alkaline phosphatase family protein [Steroidobacteraceae bacterium]|nr:alkaline phosphatase family protein [Steroidobacteraceae bacterium]